MKTLVIHPSDRTTDFLDKIYENIDATVIRGDVSQEFLGKQIDQNEQVYMLGHGTPQGLLGFNRLTVDHRMVDRLRSRRRLVGVWCNADGFFLRNDLAGLYTGMIISEPMEAQVFNVKATREQLADSNVRLATALRDALEVYDPELAAAQTIENYEAVRVAGSGLWYTENPVIEYNKQNIYDTGGSIELTRRHKEAQNVATW